MIRIVGMLLIGCLPNLYSATITVVPSQSIVALGSQVTLDISVSGLGNGSSPSLSQYEVTLAFDQSILSLNSITYGTQLSLGSGSSVVDSIGVSGLTLEEISFVSEGDLLSQQQPSFLMASIVFDTLSLGSTDLTLSVGAFLNEIGNPISPSIMNSRLDVLAVSSVPEPRLALTLLPLLLICARKSYRS